MKKGENGTKSIQKGILLLSEVQMLLAMKRTSLAALRTSIALFMVPLAVFTALIATSKYYNLLDVAHLIIPVFVISFSLLLIGIFMFILSINRIVKIDRKIGDLMEESEMIKKLIEASDVKLKLPSISDLTKLTKEVAKITHHPFSYKK